MAPIPPQTLNRVIYYHQTTHDRDGNHVSLLPLLVENTGVTHVIVAAIHINESPGDITLNNHPPSHERYDALWNEVDTLQFGGIKVLGMLGGAAKGTFTRLDGDETQFEQYYLPLKAMIAEHSLDGLDLDVEEDMSLEGIVRLIDRLRSDFGRRFLITLAPVAGGLMGGPHLSGFDYEALEVMRGKEIAWYNTQFYNGWGTVENIALYEFILSLGYKSDKVVLGMLTNPTNGSAGWVPVEHVQEILASIRERHGHLKFGGVMGWEYFNSLPGDVNKPWEWGRMLSEFMDADAFERRPATRPQSREEYQMESRDW